MKSFAIFERGGFAIGYDLRSWGVGVDVCFGPWWYVAVHLGPVYSSLMQGVD